MSDELTTIDISPGSSDSEPTRYSIPQGETALDQEAILHACIRRAARNGVEEMQDLESTLISMARRDFIHTNGRRPEDAEMAHLKTKVADLFETVLAEHPSISEA